MYENVGLQVRNWPTQMAVSAFIHDLAHATT